LLACICTSSSNISEPESTTVSASTSTPELTPADQSLPTIASSPTIEPLIDVFSIIGKPVEEVESILGPTVLITPNDDNDDVYAGGEYRDYELGSYDVFVTYDKNGISRVFQVLDGLSDENYSLTEWDQILPKFGVFLTSQPDREAPAAFYWDNYAGYNIAVIALGTSGQPVWTVQISDASFSP
jgi:hypothetical protein